MNVNIESSWKTILKEEFEKPYFSQIVSFLKQEKAAGQIIYPHGRDIFRAFEKTPFDKVKVVILGQDPYHGPGQAHGLAFSVPHNAPLPPSLKNIFKELYDDLQIQNFHQGNLEKWAECGVLLLNASLTVEADKAGSHAHIGWQTFTDRIIQLVGNYRERVVFIFWGNYAKQKIPLVPADKHCILTAVHPSPLSAHRGFFGCKHFSKTNNYLQQHNILPIDWRV